MYDGSLRAHELGGLMIDSSSWNTWWGGRSATYPRVYSPHAPTLCLFFLETNVEVPKRYEQVSIAFEAKGTDGL